MGDTDRLKAAMESLVRASVPNLDFFGRYPCKVAAQNADGTLELVPDDPRIPAQSAIPIYIGVPGMSVTVSPGARVLLAWAAADPSKPIAELWQLGSVTALNINATTITLNGGTKAVARAGDACTFNLSCPNTGTGPVPVTGTITVNAGAPGVKA